MEGDGGKERACRHLQRSIVERKEGMTHPHTPRETFSCRNERSEEQHSTFIAKSAFNVYIYIYR